MNKNTTRSNGNALDARKKLSVLLTASVRPGPDIRPGNSRLSVVNDQAWTEDARVFYVSEEVFVNGEKRMIRRLFLQGDEDDEEGVGWVINEDITSCMICSAEFGAFLWPHHCRSCGNLVCDGCSPERAVIDQMSELGEQRVCVQCYWGQHPVNATQIKSFADFDMSDVAFDFADTNFFTYEKYEYRKGSQPSATQTSAEIQRQQLKQGSTKTIIPTPRFVVQTVRKLELENDEFEVTTIMRKVFINVCEHHCTSVVAINGSKFFVDSDVQTTMKNDRKTGHRIKRGEYYQDAVEYEVYHVIVDPSVRVDCRKPPDDFCDISKEYIVHNAFVELMLQEVAAVFSLQLHKNYSIKQSEKYHDLPVMSLSITEAQYNQAEALRAKVLAAMPPDVAQRSMEITDYNNMGATGLTAEQQRIAEAKQRAEALKAKAREDRVAQKLKQQQQQQQEEEQQQQQQQQQRDQQAQKPPPQHLQLASTVPSPAASATQKEEESRRVIEAAFAAQRDAEQRREAEQRAEEEEKARLAAVAAHAAELEECARVEAKSARDEVEAQRVVESAAAAAAEEARGAIALQEQQINETKERAQREELIKREAAIKAAEEFAAASAETKQKEKQPEQPTMIILQPLSCRPTPLAVLKTKRSSDKIKYFINLCHDPVIPDVSSMQPSHPHYKHAALLGYETYQQLCFNSFTLNGQRFYMHIGDVDSIPDENGNCNVYSCDVVLPSQVCSMADKEEDVKHKLYIKVLKSVQRKHGIELEEGFTLPRLVGNYKAKSAGGAVREAHIDMYCLEPGGAETIPTPSPTPSTSITVGRRTNSSTIRGDSLNNSIATGRSNSSSSSSLEDREKSISAAAVAAAATGSTGVNSSKPASIAVSEETFKWNSKWNKFFNYPRVQENVIMASEIGKKNKLGRTAVRELILIDGPVKGPRLIYVEVSSMTQKGEVEWASSRPPVAALINKDTFDVLTEGRTYRFHDRTSIPGTAARWVKEINSTAAKSAK